MTKVFYIIPYDELLPFFKKEVSKYHLDNIEVTFKHIYGTDNESILSIDADVIVGRGITALAAENYHPNAHVIPIPMGTNDFSEALYESKIISMEPIGILAGSNNMCNPQHIEKMIGKKVFLQVANTQQEVNLGIDILRKKGCKLFMGGLTMSRCCQENDFPYVHIRTGLETVQRVVRDSLSAARTLEKKKVRLSLLSNLLSSSDDAVLAINNEGAIIISNTLADNLFEADLEKMNFSDICSIPEILESISLKIKGEFVREVKGRMMYITLKPMTNEDFCSGNIISYHKIEDILNEESKIRKQLSKKGLVARYTFDDILTSNDKMNLIKTKAFRYSLVEGAILIIGETGTGKELFAQSIHNASSRHFQPFVAINCATLTAELLESELFGYVGGAFTGASKEGKVGLFELAHGGTLFLDEIGEIPIIMQAKLLRVLQEKEVRRIGGDKVIPIDVRIISATNVDIGKRIKDNLFRLDLFFRLSLFSINTEPLRNRPEDIILLFENFIAEASQEYNKIIPQLDESAKESLINYPWPGNVRELRNSAKRLAILNNSKLITDKEVSDYDVTLDFFGEEKKEKKTRNISDKELYSLFLESGLTKLEFAKKYNISRSTLWRKFSQF